MSRFTHVALDNWRNFGQVDVDLERRVFLVGPNAAGKSNFLDVFRFLHDIASVGGGFQEAVLRRGGVSAIRSLSARRYSDVGIHVAVSMESSAWEYRLKFGQDKQRTPTIKEEEVRQDGRVVLRRPLADDRRDPQRLTQTYLEQVNANKDFREVVGFFASVQYLHLVPQLVREPDRSVGRSNDPYGGDFLEQVARAPEKTRNARLRRIRDALRVAVPQLEELELHRDDRGTPHLRGKYQHWRPQGAWQSERQFSDGTLRLLGLLWVTLDGVGPLLLEEPELSLHPEVVRYLPLLFGRIQRRSGRQILVSTHAPYLLEDEGIGLNEVLLLEPGIEGTIVRTAMASSEVRHLLDGGLTLPEIVLPRTRPRNARQLSMFGD